MEGCKEASLSIPLNGFYHGGIRRGVQQHGILSIPLNGFVERGGGVGGMKAVAFNSIEWIPTRLHRRSTKTPGGLSIPLNGFRVAKSRREKYRLCVTFNSIEWIHNIDSFRSVHIVILLFQFH